MSQKIMYLWKNGPREFWAFDNLYPCYPNGDPMVLGEPSGYAIVMDSMNGRPEVTHAGQVRTWMAMDAKKMGVQ